MTPLADSMLGRDCFMPRVASLAAARVQACTLQQMLKGAPCSHIVLRSCEAGASTPSMASCWQAQAQQHHICRQDCQICMSRMPIGPWQRDNCNPP